MNTIIYTLLVSFIIVAVMGPSSIRILHKIKFGQQIREEGPKWHQVKSGTPTMGGLMFILSSVVATAIFAEHNRMLWLMLLCSVAFGAIGFIDDYIKVVKKRNLGLRAWQKFSLQLIVSILYVFTLKTSGLLDTSIVIPFVNSTVNIGSLFIPFAVLVFLACSNSVNLTDGIDGLASFVTLAVSVFLTIVAFIKGETNIAIFSSAVTGGCLGFLLYNAHPAKVFMGDVGSLFLGGCISIIAIALQLELILIIAGFVYLFETLSVIIQVISFKTTGKRVFKMTPVHHHFEMSGYSEWKIVALFTTVTVVLSLVSFFAISGWLFG